MLIKLILNPFQKLNFLKNDIFDDGIFEKINNFFEGKKIDLILSDMSPNASGNKNVDHLRIVSIIEKVLDISDYFLSKNGFLIAKIFQGGAQGDLVKKNERNFIIN